MARQRQVVRQKHASKVKHEDFSALREKLFPAVVFLFSFALYFNSVFNDYNLDDELVTRNHRLTSRGIEILKPNFSVFYSGEFKGATFKLRLFNFLPEVFRSPYYEDPMGYKYEYRPVVLASFAIEHSIFDESPHVSHLINVFLYGLLCVLLYLVLTRLLKEYNIILPFITALIFAAHPIHTEVVASIKNRDEILALGFGLLSLLFAVKFTCQGKVSDLALIPVFFFIGILAKSTTITFAFLIPLCIVMFTNVDVKQLTLITVLLILPTVFYSRLYSVLQQVLLAGTLAFAVTTLYYLKNYEVTLRQITGFIMEKYRNLMYVNESKATISVSLDFTFLNHKILLLPTVLIVLASLCTSASGIYMGKMWLSVLPLMLFSILFVIVRNELKLIFVTPVTLIVILVMAKFSLEKSLIEAGFILFLASQILHNNKHFRIVGFLNYLFYSIVSVAFLHSHFFLAIFLFIGFLSRRLLPLGILMFSVSLAVFGVSVYRLIMGIKEFNLALLSIPFLYLGYLLFRKHYHRFLYNTSVLCIPLLILLHFLVNPTKAINNRVNEALLSGYHQISSIRAPEATPVQALRPVKFIENPIEKTDPLNIKLGTAMIILGKYLKLIFVPFPMSYYYGYAYIVPTSLWQFIPLFILLIHIFIFTAAIVLIKKSPLLSFSALFYLTSISVFSNLFLPVPGMIGDRFLFTPSIGLSLVLVVLIGMIFKQSYTEPKLKLTTLNFPSKTSITAILILYSILTISRNFDWKNHLTLFRHDIKTVENSAQAQNLLGLHLSMGSNAEVDILKQKQMREEAVVHLKRAVEIYPGFLNAIFDLGRTYEALGRFDEAYKAYKSAIELDSTFLAPCRFLGLYHDSKANLDSAIYFYKKYLTAYPLESDINANLSYAYFKQGKYDSSIAVNHRYLKLNPNSIDAVTNIAKTYLQANMKDSARVYFRQALTLNPSDANIAKTIKDIK